MVQGQVLGQKLLDQWKLMLGANIKEQWQFSNFKDMGSLVILFIH